MRKFNLKAALAGEPLVTRDGHEVKTFSKADGDLVDISSPDMVYSAEIVLAKNAAALGYSKEGAYMSGKESSLDLFMAEPEFKEGDKVLVGDVKGDITHERIFVYKDMNGFFFCVEGGHETNYDVGHRYSLFGWKYCQHLLKEPKNDFKPVMGDIILVSKDNEKWERRVFIEKENAVYVCLLSVEDKIEQNNHWKLSHLIMNWPYAKPFKN